MLALLFEDCLVEDWDFLEGLVLFNLFGLEDSLSSYGLVKHGFSTSLLVLENWVEPCLDLCKSLHSFLNGHVELGDGAIRTNVFNEVACSRLKHVLEFLSCSLGGVI